MSLKKFIVGISLSLFFTSFLFSQSLAELAKKEKERREKLKGKETTVVTNADLGQLTKRPALSTTRSQSSEPPISPQKASPTTSSRQPLAPPLDKNVDTMEPGEGQETPEDLQANWLQAQEYVGLLQTRLNGLWQEFYSMDDMSDREGIQAEIRKTAAQLEKAQQEEARAKQAWEKASSGLRKSKKRSN